MAARTPTRRQILIGIVLLAVVAYLATAIRVEWKTIDPRPTGTVADLETLADGETNVLFILIDTLRSHRLHGYGYERETSPLLDRLGDGGIRFARNVSQSSWTKSSMASLWTGLSPLRSGVTRFDHGIPEDARMPAEVFRDAGFQTVGIYRNGWVSGYFGFEQGFESYYKPAGQPLPANVRRQNPNIMAGGTDIDIIQDAKQFLRINGDERFFLYLHLMDVHEFVYDEYSNVFGVSNSDIYDNAILRTNQILEDLTEFMAESGHLENTLIVIASDHGEAFGERGLEGHAREVFAETTETPLILSLPFRLDPGIVVEQRSSNVDIWPTVFDLIGLEGADDLDGRSRVPEIRAAAEGRKVPGVERAVAYLDQNWGQNIAENRHRVAVIEGDFRYVMNAPYGKDPATRIELLEASDGEQANRIEEFPEVAARLEEAANEELEREPPWADQPRIDIDEMQLNQLRALGYQLPE